MTKFESWKRISCGSLWTHQSWWRQKDNSSIGIQWIRGDSDLNNPCVLYVPGRHATSSIVFENPMYDLRQIIARKGFSIASVYFRNFQAETSEAMKYWTLGTWIDDLKFLASKVCEIQKCEAIPVIGHSMGATFAFLAASESNKLSHVVALDGGVLTPFDDCVDFDLEAELVQMNEMQQWADPNPQVAQYFQSLTDHDNQLELLRIIKKNALKTRSGVMFASSDHFDYFRAQLLASYVWRWPRLVTLMARAVSLRVKHESLFRFRMFAGSIDVPILAVIAGARGAPLERRIKFSAKTASASNPDMLKLSGLGHLDLVFHPELKDRVATPICNWLNSKVN